MSNDLLDELHAQAALQLLAGDPGINLYAGEVPDAKTYPYVLAYTAVQRPASGEGQSFDGRTSTIVTRWYLHCVGTSEQAARTVGSRVAGLLINVRPTIAGRSCGLIQQEASPPPVRDESTGVAVFDVAAVYILTTFAG